MPFFTSIVDLKDPDLDHGVYVQCLQLRRDVFIRGMGWNLYEQLGCEFDEYDTPASVHVVGRSGGQVLGCMRLLRTDNRQGNLTYMILDAHRGRIPNLPANLVEEEIQSNTAWEASRIAISHMVPKEQRNAMFYALIAAGVEHISRLGANTLLGMMNPVFHRVLTRGGFNCYKFGPTRAQRDGRICVLRLDFVPQIAGSVFPSSLLKSA